MICHVGSDVIDVSMPTLLDNEVLVENDLDSVSRPVSLRDDEQSWLISEGPGYALYRRSYLSSRHPDSTGEENHSQRSHSGTGKKVAAHSIS